MKTENATGMKDMHGQECTKERSNKKRRAICSLVTVLFALALVIPAQAQLDTANHNVFQADIFRNLIKVGEIYVPARKAVPLIKHTGNPSSQTVNLQCSTSKASVTTRKIFGTTKFEHKAEVSITTDAAFVPSGTFIKYSVNGYPPKTYKVGGELGIPPYTTIVLGWYTILLDEKEPWPDGCSASYTNN